MTEQKIAPVLSDDRAEFEAWCKPRGYRVLRAYPDVDRYQHPETDVAWETWQAVLAKQGAVRDQALEEIAVWHAVTGWMLDQKDVPEAIRALKGTPAALVADARPADSSIKDAFVKAMGNDNGWLGEKGSWFIEGYRAAPQLSGNSGQVADAQPLGDIKVGNLPTINRDEYPDLGDWWVQLRIGAKKDEVLARVYGNSPQQAVERAHMLAAKPVRPALSRGAAIQEVTALCSQIPGATVWNAAQFMYDLLAAQPSAQAQPSGNAGELDTARLDWISAQECSIESMSIDYAPKYRLRWWDDVEACQADWYDDPRAAIDAAIVASKEGAKS